MNASEQLRREWMAKLAIVCSPAFAKEATVSLVVMLDDLTEFGDEFFCNETRKLIALSDRRQSVPSLDEIYRVFGQWWRSRQPPARLIAQSAPREPDRVPPSPEEVEKVDALVAEMTSAMSPRRGHPFESYRRGSTMPKIGSVVPPSPPGVAVRDTPIAVAARAQRAREQAEKGESS